jgi:hypothetical protein
MTLDSSMSRLVKRRAALCALRVLLAVVPGACSAPVPLGASADASPETDGDAGADAPAASDAGGCDRTRIVGLAVATSSATGDAPYAIDGCLLAYIAPDRAVHAVDLATGTARIVGPAAEQASAVVVSDGRIAWESGATPATPTIGVVRFADPTTITRVIGPAGAGEPRLRRGTLVYTRWVDALDTDVYARDLATGVESLIAGGPAQQRFAAVDDATIAITDFSEDPDGRYGGTGTDLADVLVYDRAGKTLTARHVEGKQAFPILDDLGLVAYLSWPTIPPEPKFQAYELRVGALAADPAGDRTIALVRSPGPEFVRPSVWAGTLEWLDARTSPAVLMRAPIDGRTGPVTATAPDTTLLFSPASTAGFTILAVRPSTGVTAPAALDTVARP